MCSDIKNQLRTKIKNERILMSESQKKQFDKEIADNLIKSNILKNRELVLIYMSTKIEVGTDKIIEYCLNNSIPVAIPRCTASRKMDFYLYNKNTILEKSKFGIFEPPENKQHIIKSYKNAVCIVPGLCFDKKGYRLGYGGGFYDTLLCENPYMTSVGICYSCHITEKLPVGKYDKKVNFIITEKNMEMCNG